MNITNIIKAAVFTVAFFSLSSAVFAEQMTACYDASYFFKIGETCITYKYDENGFEIKSEAKTVNLGAAFKPLVQHGISFLELNPLRTKNMILNEQGSTYTVIHDYYFNDDHADFVVTKTRSKNGEIKKVKKGTVKGKNFIDPYAGMLAIQMDKSGDGIQKIFFEGKIVHLSYKNIGKEIIRTDSGIYKTRILETSPKVETDGNLVPKGKWRFWIDEISGALIKMEVEFSIGKVILRLDKVQGNKYLLSKIFNY